MVTAPDDEEQLAVVIEQRVGTAAVGRELDDRAGLRVDLQERDRVERRGSGATWNIGGDVEAGLVGVLHVGHVDRNVAIVCVPSAVTRWIAHEPPSARTRRRRRLRSRNDPGRESASEDGSPRTGSVKGTMVDSSAPPVVGMR